VAKGILAEQLPGYQVLQFEEYARLKKEGKEGDGEEAVVGQGQGQGRAKRPRVECGNGNGDGGAGKGSFGGCGIM
jgi:hypothetical protein